MMVFEEFLSKIGKRKFYSFFLGLLYVFISYGTSLIFFPNHVSISMLFFVTLLLVPSAMKLISLEEKKESKDGLSRFVQDHAIIIEVLLFLFIGVFMGYFCLGFVNDSSIFSYQQSFLENQGINQTTTELFSQNAQSFGKFSSILMNNLTVCLIAFVLSIFYGVGAMFLIVLNASVFASFVQLMFQYLGDVGNKMIMSGIFFTYMIPEVAGFLMASLAGGVISKAVINEKIGSLRFKNVVKDATVLLVIAVLIILLAAFLEVFVAPYALKTISLK